MRIQRYLLWMALCLLLGACETDTGLKPSAPSSARPKSAQPQNPKPVVIEVTSKGYVPSVLQTRVGEPLKVVFRRTSEQGCGQEVVFPTEDIRRTLPLQQDVEVTLQPNVEGTISFTCGMGMYQGRITVRK